MNVRLKPFIRKTLPKNAIAMATAAACCLVSASFTANAAVYTVDETREGYAEISTALNTQIMEEGMVLLKNDGALPLASGSTVDLLGVGSYYTLWGETGGGNGKTDYTYLADSLEHAGFTVNSYAEGYAAAKQVTLAGAKVYLEPVTDSLNLSGGGTAIITLSRSGKESSDNETAGSAALVANGWEEGDHQLRLNINERSLLETAKQKYATVIVLINSPTSIQIPELEADPDIGAIMYIGMPGQYGLEAVGKVLNGSVSPSGRTVDTWASDFTKDPTYANFGSATGTIKDDQGEDIVALEYEEGIYVGYKYYETAAAENFIDYDQSVTYPFGYGLSYTSFTQQFVKKSFEIPADAGFDTYIDVQVNVTNCGNAAGKEVVQLYSHAPYTAGEIEKAEAVLVGFAKTDLLGAGESQTVTVRVRVGDIASFDWNDANRNHWYGYEIEKGDYELRLQKNSHEIIESIPYTVGETLAYDNDGGRAAVTEEDNKKNLVFSKGDDFDSLALASQENGGDFVVMSRADFAGTFPVAPNGSVNASATVTTKYSSEFKPDRDRESDPWYVSEVPQGWTQNAGTDYLLFDMAGIDYTDTDVIREGKFAGKTGVEAWTEFMNQLTWEELIKVPSTGSHMTASVSSIGKPQQYDTDGPEQLGYGTFWACANIIAGTWNVTLCYERGVALGNEALYDGYTGWYGPTANINRSPFGGRNNIYFSEDALLAGKISAANIGGAQSRGVVAYVKHFALNEQETARSGLATFITEQALRETYLKAFEFTVKEGGAIGMMQSMNRIGGVNCYGNYALDQVVLREEWGFLGGVITDSYSSDLVRENMAQRMGGDFPLGTYLEDFAGEWDASANMLTYDGEPSPTQWYVIRNAAMHVLYMAANSSQMRNGYDLTEVIGKTISAEIVLNAEAEPIDAGIDAAKFGTQNIVYTATGLPDGLTIDGKTGVIGGTPTEEGKFKVSVKVGVAEEGEEWISVSYQVTLTVTEGTASDGGSFPIAAVVGIAAGTVVVLACAGFAIFFALKHKKTDKR